MMSAQASCRCTLEVLTETEVVPMAKNDIHADQVGPGGNGHIDHPPSDWQTISSRITYENPWIAVEHHEVINPAGKPGIYGTVRFRNLAVAILPIDDEGYTYLVGQFRYALNCYSWELPEGGCPLVEEPLVAARRELLEETGLQASDWSLILEMDISNSVTDERSFSYLARNLRQGTSQPDDTENLKVRRVHLSEVYRMILSGEIRDALTVATVLKAAALLSAFDAGVVTSTWSPAANT